MVKKRFPFFLVLVAVLILPSFVSAMVLWDQPLSVVSTGTYYSNMFVPSNESDTFLADDFVNDQIWEISSIFIPGNFWTRYGNQSTLNNAAALNWAIYADDGNGKPDGYPIGNGNEPVWSVRLTPPFNTDHYQATVSLGSDYYKSDVKLTFKTPHVLPAGHYWLIFYPELEYYAYGGYGRQPSDTENNEESQFIQPGGGDPPLPTIWTSVLDIPWSRLPFPKPRLTQQDLAFRIEGTMQNANINVDPMTLSFGRGRIGIPSDPQIVTITNTGTTNLSLSSITVGGTAASMYTAAPGLVNGCSLTGDTLSADESCTVAVTFTPSDSGTKTACLQINSNATNAGIIRVTLVGIGSDATPSVIEGTIGTEITFTAAPSTNFKSKKGKVVIYDNINNKVKSNLKISKTGWSPTTITDIVTKALEAKQYNVQISVQPYKTERPIDIEGGFTFKRPEVTGFVVDNGSPGETRTVNGRFFGNKKPKIYLWYYDKNSTYKKKTCPVSTITWNAQTGASSANFKVPKLDPGSYRLTVETKKVGTSMETINFTINGVSK